MGLRTGDILEGEVFPEPVQVVFVQPMGDAWRIGGMGLRTRQYHERLLSTGQPASLKVIPSEATFQGDGWSFRLRIEAARPEVYAASIADGRGNTWRWPCATSACGA